MKELSEKLCLTWTKQTFCGTLWHDYQVSCLYVDPNNISADNEKSWNLGNAW